MRYDTYKSRRILNQEYWRNVIQESKVTFQLEPWSIHSHFYAMDLIEPSYNPSQSYSQE